VSDLPESVVAVPSRGRLTRLWSELRLAARGTKHDYTTGSIGRAIFLLAVPMVLEMVMESVFAVVDIFWVARLGPDAVATVGLTESLMAVVYTLAIGLAIGATATVARRIGEKNPDAAARAAMQAIGLGVIVSATLGVIGGTLAPRLLAGEALDNRALAALGHGGLLSRDMAYRFPPYRAGAARGELE